MRETETTKKRKKFIKKMLLHDSIRKKSNQKSKRSSKTYANFDKLIQQRIRVWVEGSSIRSIKELGDITFFPPPEKDKRTKEYKEWIKYVDAKIKWTATKYWREANRHNISLHYRRFQDENERFVHFYEELTGKKESEKEDGCFLSILLLLIPTSGLFILLLS